MTDFQLILDAECAIPSDRPLAEIVGELSEALRSPDPVVRDKQAYPILAHWIDAGHLDEPALLRLGDEMAARFDDPEIQARTFAPLLLDCIVSAGAFSPAWVDALERWYPAETDLRGHDPERGWLHAYAHGADLLGTFGICPQVKDPARMLDLAARRLVAPTGYVLQDMEDDRLGYSIALALSRPEVTADLAVAWLDPIAEEIARPWAGAVPPVISNALRTLRSVYVIVDRGVRPQWGGDEVRPIPHRDLVKDRIAAILAVTAPFSG